MLVDSWAWVEIFKQSEWGVKARAHMASRKVFVSVLSLAEVADWCARNGKPPLPHLDAIKRVAVVLPIDEKIAEIAGRSLKSFKVRAKGFGMIDALIYSQAIVSQMPLMTGDPHFRGMEGIVFLA